MWGLSPPKAHQLVPSMRLAVLGAVVMLVTAKTQAAIRQHGQLCPLAYNPKLLGLVVAPVTGLE
ncbi:unnamed protein product [Schistocephalus solidus]|uniref:Secreted protein n=1 Tax=Schistocephalus solidus TaxID=70667 RepID=A0A183TUI3_SCHSO|nr:unnamed protein product [Schistocephalus solidus]